MKNLPFPLYHGTSSLFLKSIIDHGLGGTNPIEEWGIIAFARDIIPLIDEYLGDDEQYAQRIYSYKMMAEQKNAGWNYQHGDTYLSPAKQTAIRYAVNKQYGSEILTYSLEFLEELSRRNVPSVNDSLYQKYAHIFALLDTSPCPLLIRIDKPKQKDLITERGKCAEEQIENLIKHQKDDPSSFQLISQQSNFRLIKPASADRIKIFFINVINWDPITPEYQLYKLQHK